MTTNSIESVHAHARRVGAHVSPFRLGIAAGELDYQGPNPYAAGSRGSSNFADGVCVGESRRLGSLGSLGEREYQSWIDALRGQA